NEMFFDNVRVPKDCLVGEKNGGLGLIITELDIERASGLGLDTAARCRRMLDELIDYAGRTKRNGRLLCEDPVIRQALAERATEIEVTRLLGYRVLWLLTKGIVAHTEASVSKVYGSEMLHRLANTGVQVLGLNSGLQSDPNWPPVSSRLWDCCLLSFTWLIAGGTNEIQKNIIASGGLGLPNA
ncbi:acyl-CoA dehydrogenase family protein, partial [Chloroflexota bacterium]